MIKSIAVYCGHEDGNNPEFIVQAKKLGELLARNKINMVFGGGNVGLMGAAASGAVENGGHVTGITTPHVMALQEPVRDDIQNEVIDGINERKQRMYELSDGFCILPGGIGTLNELTDILTMQQIGETKKPIFFLNTDKFWEFFGQTLVHMQNAGFIREMDAYDINIANDADELIQMILNKNS